MAVSARLRLLGSVAMCGWASCAFGQQAPTTTVAVPANAETGIADIVVTAQRRSESVQRSSLAISVLTPETLARSGVTSTSDLTRVLPGVQIGISGPIPQVFIRGIGDFSSTAVTNPAVALNVGGVYWARPGAVGGTFFDIARVEVLKGPQGTLYGRNASGGAINIIPVRPKLGKVEGIVNIEAGNYRALSSDGAINLPLGESFAVRAAYQIAHRDGYLSDGGNDDKHQSARLQALWEPSADVSVLAFGSYYHAGGVGNGYVLYDPNGNPLATPPRAATPNFDPWTSTTDPRGAAILATGAPSPVFKPGDPAGLYQNTTFWNGQAELTANFGFATLTVIPAYQHARMDYRIYPALSYQTRDGNGFGSPETSRTYSAEARLSNDGTVLKWVLGAFYYDEEQEERSTIDNGLAQNISISGRIRTKSAAVFGQATFSVTDALRLVAGLRYTNDRRELANGQTRNNNAPGAPIVEQFGGKAESNKVNYKAGIEYDLTDRNMVFATVATGFKGGGTQLAVANAFRPEALQAFEVGSRNRFLDNRLQINVEGFYWKYKDHQEVTIGPDDLGVIAALIVNAGKAESYGADVDVVFQATASDRLSGNIEYNKTKYTEFSLIQPFAFLPPGHTGCAVTPTGLSGPVGPTATVDCSGFPLARAPLWSGGASYSHIFDLAHGGTIDFTADAKFASARFLSVDFTPNTHAGAYQTFGASLTYASAGGLAVTAFIRNISNEHVYTGASQSSFVPTFVGANINPPRTYGARISYHF